MDRKLIGQTSLSGEVELRRRFVNDLELKNRLLIRRELRNRSLKWFDTFPRTPTTDDLIDPRIAAALQVGYFTRLASLPIGRNFERSQTPTGYLATETNRLAFLEFQGVCRDWRNEREHSEWRQLHHYRLTAAADGLLGADHELRIWYDLGAMLGDLLVDIHCKWLMENRPMVYTASSFDLSSGGIIDLTGDLKDEPDPLRQQCKIRAVAESVRVSRHLTYKLELPESPEAFVGETLSTLASYYEELRKSREGALCSTPSAESAAGALEVNDPTMGQDVGSPGNHEVAELVNRRKVEGGSEPGEDDGTTEVPKVEREAAAPDQARLDVPDDPITLEQAARLVGQARKTLYNNKNKRPRPAIGGGKGKLLVFSYKVLRPWLTKNWRAALYRLSENYEETKKYWAEPTSPQQQDAGSESDDSR